MSGPRDTMPDLPVHWARQANGDVADPKWEEQILGSELPRRIRLLLAWIVYDDGSGLNSHEIEWALLDCVNCERE